MMSLSDEQAIFTRQITALTALVNSTGQYRIRDGDCYRDPRVRYGKRKSLHRSRLARDLILDKRTNNNGWTYQRSTAAYQWIGTIWKMMDEQNRWGGDFTKPDGNHFSRAIDNRA
jgi:hypothetical protein